MDIYSYFYDVPFNPWYPSQNLITSNHNHFGQFSITVVIQSWRTYILVVTTLKNGITRDFFVRAAGPASVTLISFTPTTPLSSV
jgi:hypothetical protein